LIPFTHRYRWTPNYHEFDLMHVAHISSSSSSTTLKKDENRGGDDAKPEASWIDIYLPKKARPYAKLARLDKPIGTWLLAWPCMWLVILHIF
jgi:4-hydroxybenzoate polyprenyltransferase